MNRLDFLKRLFSTAVVAVVTPSILLGKEENQQDAHLTDLPSAVTSIAETTNTKVRPELKEKRGGLDVIVGARATGKTYYTKNKIQELLTGKNPKKVLVLDVNNEYTDIKTISERDIIAFSNSKIIEARRIVKFEKGSFGSRGYSKFGWEQLTKKVLERYRNGHLIIEQPIELSPEVIGGICTTRTFNRPTTMMFNSLNQIPQKVIQNSDAIQLFKTIDVPKKEKLAYVHTPVKIMNNILNIKNKKSKHNYLCLDHNYKISGQFTNEEWDEAVDTYIKNTRKSIKDKNYYLRYRA